jgi:hypothetical protein
MLFFSSLFTISYLDGGGHDGSRAVVSDGTMGKVFAIQNILVGPEEFPELFFRHSSFSYLVRIFQNCEQTFLGVKCRILWSNPLENQTRTTFLVGSCLAKVVEDLPLIFS